MSRCFPFPPPGYEKKARLDAGLLKKEKSYEKKLRKEKKDKEKSQSKEKKSKDRSQEKQKESNEKKVKKRDKRDDKDKDKDTKKASDERRLLGKSETHNGENQEQQVNDSFLFEKTYYEQSAGYSEAKHIQNNHQAEKTQRSEFRIRYNEGEKLSTAQSERDDKMVRLVAKGAATSMEQIKDVKVDDSKISSLGIRENAKFSPSSMVQSSAATVQIGVEVVSKPQLEKKDSKSSERKTESGKERNEEMKKGNDNEKRKEKNRDTDGEKEVKTKDNDRENKKKSEKKLEKLDDINSRGDMKASKETNNEKSISSHSLKASQLPADSDKSANPEVNFKKRKEFENNGFLLNDIRPIKFQKLTSSALPNPGYGAFVTCAIETQGSANNLKLDSKEGKINGVIEAHSSVSSIKPTSTRQVDQMAPPHPDCRYLSQIYSLPKVEERSDIGDQEWLSKSSNAKEKKPKSSEVEQMPLVWAKAVPIESADVCALPYVIPY